MFSASHNFVFIFVRFPCVMKIDVLLFQFFKIIFLLSKTAKGPDDSCDLLAPKLSFGVDASIVVF